MTTGSPLRILIDTNIFIAAESDATNPHANAGLAAELFRVATALGHTVCVGAGILEDLARHKDPAHRQKRRQQLQRYHLLTAIPIPKGFQAEAGYPPGINDQSRVDMGLLLALRRGAAQWFVSEDQRIIPHAKKLGLEDLVFNLGDALDVLKRQLSQPILVPSVEEIPGYGLDPDDPIFDGFAEEYGIRKWLHDKVAAEQRPCLVMRDIGGELDAVVILKHEVDQTWTLDGRVLKICTFKVAERARGLKRGEMLLWSIFEHARLNQYDAIFVEAFENEVELVEMFKSFGFDDLAPTHRTDERAYGKRLHPAQGGVISSPLEYNIAYGPGAMVPDRFFLVPIIPTWHRMLFPVANATAQLSLMGDLTDPGNAIRKAYVCQSSSKQLRAGDSVLFLRTRDRQMVNVVGVVENTMRSSDPTEILTFTGRRTVYAPDEISHMCSRGEVLAIRFRLDRVLDTPLSMNELIEKRAMSRSPQSIQQVRNRGAISWLKDLLTD